ncbi:MAG: serine/threonine-protein kinase [Thermaerobacter sp.]|nr:serine/threonine-protein kinase [Thermaerobacter sp.]
MRRLTGTTLGPYRVLEQLGRGGMAVVYKAYHPPLDRYVALKVIAEAHAEDPQFQERFRREAQAAAKLRHPNIVTIYDFGTEADLHYLAMEFLEGRTLKALLAAREPAPPDLGIVVQTARALAYAHSQGVVHRDVKPSNIIVSPEGRAVLTDFGVARMLQQEGLTAPGVGIGTPEYMAPEEAEGNASDHRSDLYSLGVVCYEMVTGRVPFRADTPLAVLLSHLRDPLPLPSELNPSIPPALERFLLRALAKDPAERFPDGAAMAQALEEVCAGLPAGQASTVFLLPGPAQTQAAPPPRRRFPRAVGLAVAAVVLALALFGYRQLAAPLPAPLLTVDPSSGPPGTHFLARIRRLQPGELLRLSLVEPDGQVLRLRGPAFHADAHGSERVILFQSATRVPLGQYFLSATGAKGEISNTVSFRVTPPSATAPG